MKEISIQSYLTDDNSIQWDSLLGDILKTFNCSTGTIHTLNKTDGMLHVLTQQGIPEHIMPAVSIIPVGKGIAGAAAEKRQPVEICNLQTDDGGVAKKAAKDTKVSGSLAVPIENQGGELLGTLGIGKFEPYQFTDEEKSDLTSMAKLIAESALMPQ